MSTLSTLFGGLVAVALLYAAGGAVRGLPPVLRAVLAGVLPLIGYFVLIIGRWPGLDVVAMHISVFLAAALVLFVLTQFRQRSIGRMHWAPKLLIAFFLGLVVLNGSLLYIATKGLPGPVARWWFGSDVHSGFSGVVAHGQDAAKSVSAELSQAHRESQLGWKVEFGGLDTEGRTQPIQIRVRDRTGLPVDGVDAEVRVMRPGASATALKVNLQAVEPGVYVGAVNLPASGRWIAELRLSQDGGLRFQSTREVVAE